MAWAAWAREFRFSGAVSRYFEGIRSFLGVFGSSPLLWGRGGLHHALFLVVGCLWVLAGAGCLRAAAVSTMLVGKIVSSRRGLVCMDSVPVTLNGDFV